MAGSTASPITKSCCSWSKAKPSSGETRHVRPGDFMFVPRDAIHGTVATKLEPLSFLSIITPRIDLTKDLIWENEPPRFRMI
jgi:mannose-6-phosphate isomerase-like protein (cupin superfamily)